MHTHTCAPTPPRRAGHIRFIIICVFVLSDEIVSDGKNCVRSWSVAGQRIFIMGVSRLLGFICIFGTIKKDSWRMEDCDGGVAVAFHLVSLEKPEIT